MSVTSPTSFYINVTGQIETGKFIDGDDLYLHYLFTQGQDWEIVAGLEEGFSQIAHLSKDERRIFVWNFPLDITFKSTNPFGWPKLVITIFGSDIFGHHVVRGYATCHIPITPGPLHKKLTTFVPESASSVQKFMSWLTGSRPEFVDPKIIAQERGREMTRVRSQGQIELKFNVMMKDFDKLGYDCGYGDVNRTGAKSSHISQNAVSSPQSSATRRHTSSTIDPIAGPSHAN